MNVTDCLANTGGTAHTALVLIGVAVVLLGLGVLAFRSSRSSRSRKHQGAALGALALVAALTLVPLASPSGAYAATGDCTPAPSQPAADAAPDAAADPTPSPNPDPTPDPDVTYVAPEAPTTVPVCGVAPVITTPESEYFSYETVQDASTATVTATLRGGLADIAVAPGAQTAWTFDMSFTPATALTAESFAFTYDGSSPNPRINDETVATFLEAQSAPLEFTTVSEASYTYAVFDIEGNRLIDLGETTQLSRYETNFSAVQAGQDVELTYTGSSEVDGYERAVAYFEAKGGLPEGTRIGTRGSSGYESTASLTASYVNECGVAGSVTATTPFEIVPV